MAEQNNEQSILWNTHTFPVINDSSYSLCVLILGGIQFSSQIATLYTCPVTEVFFPTCIGMHSTTLTKPICLHNSTIVSVLSNIVVWALPKQYISLPCFQRVSVLWHSLFLHGTIIDIAEHCIVGNTILVDRTYDIGSNFFVKNTSDCYHDLSINQIILEWVVD